MNIESLPDLLSNLKFAFLHDQSTFRYASRLRSYSFGPMWILDSSVLPLLAIKQSIFQRLIFSPTCFWRLLRNLGGGSAADKSLDVAPLGLNPGVPAEAIGDQAIALADGVVQANGIRPDGLYGAASPVVAEEHRRRALGIA